MTIRWLVILVAFVALLIWVRWAFAIRCKHHKRLGDTWLTAVPPTTWLTHVILFFSAAAMHLLSPQWLNIWSSAVYIHGAIMLGVYGIGKCFRDD